MTHFRFKLLLALFAINFSSYAQTDTLQNSKTNSQYKYFREKLSSILLGAQMQQVIDPSGHEFRRAYIEVGFHKTVRTNYAMFTYGPSIELSPYNHTIIGFKYGGWTNIYFISLGLNTIYYTDFNGGDLIVRPEFGFGIDRFRFAIGYNASIISNEKFERVKKQKPQLTLNLLLKYKRL
jgi:hypothetical protein